MGRTMKLNYSKSRSTKANIRLRALEEMWNRGKQVERILDECQMDLYNFYHDADRAVSSRIVILASRRLGKSVFAFAAADEVCRNNPGSRVLYLSKTNDNLNEILDQVSTVYLQSCPDNLKPELKVKAMKYVYPNGSEIRFKGMDRAGADSVRGVKAQLVIFDEFCFMDDLISLVKSTIGPMINEQKGKMIFISSAPLTPGHESLEIIQEAEACGMLVRKTIYDCPRWTAKDIEEFANDAGGKDSTVFKREYMCELVTEVDRAILPACTESHMKNLVKEWPKPTDYIPDHYISIDPGGRDKTAILFSYYDYLEATLIIEDEVLLDNPSTEEIAKSIDVKLKGEWKGITPHKIIMDNNNLILVKDMQKLHGMSVKATKKDKKEAQVNNTNILLQNKQIMIHPRCKQLIAQCRYGIWNKARTGFERTAALSHCDAVDALVYLVRNINRNRNPIPEVMPDMTNRVNHDRYMKDSGKNVFKKLFSRR